MTKRGIAMMRRLVISALFGVGVFIGSAAASPAPLDDLVKAAEAGNAAAQYRLGVLYLRGSPETPKDLPLAISWVQKAANQGLAHAQNTLGVIYNEGIGTTADFNEARRWWLKAADQGLAPAQFNLGRSYEHGIPQDFKQAASWYEKAAGQGDRHAQAALGTLYLKGSGVPKDVRKAEELWRKAANQGVGYAQFNLGLFYESGAGGQKDLAQAESWFAKAAAAGFQRAAQKLADVRKLRAEGRTEKTETDVFPPPGPKQTYKGKTLIGSTYSGADNETFFATVKQGLDMMEKLPGSLRDGVNLIREVSWSQEIGQGVKVYSAG
jgi:TPR repeat protein